MIGAPAPWSPDPDDDGLRFVGSPETLFRAIQARHADQARFDWNAYLTATLAGSQAVGGRFNPRCEFGALYAAESEATAWEEAAARWRREGFSGLPQTMVMLHFVVAAGKLADLREQSVREDFEVTLEALTNENPTDAEKESCLRVARAVRALADFAVSPSARADGYNIPLYPDRPESELQATFAAALSGRVPAHLIQAPAESW